MELKMEWMSMKLERRNNGIGGGLPSTRPSSLVLPNMSPLPPSSVRVATTIEDDDKDKGGDRPSRRRKRISFQFYNPNFKMFSSILLLFFFLSSNRICSLVEGNSEIESCVRIMHSELNSGSAASANSGGSGAEHVEILCQIRVLHPELDFENLTSSIPFGGFGNSGGSGFVNVMTITKLNIVCNDVLFFESGVSPDQLSGLPELRELAIEKCKLRHIPADFLSLRHLRKLTIKTGNSDWAARSLEISPGALSQVPQLRHLNLGFNHMWKLPERLLCQVGSHLTHLNLTRNLMSDIFDLGLSSGSGRLLALSQGGIRSSTNSPPGGGGGMDGCLTELKSLDLSFNLLRTLGNHAFSNMRKLTELRIENNMLEELEQDAFAGLGQLKKLNVSSNRLVALPAKLFVSTPLISELDLRNNSLTALAPGLFNGLANLQTLDISRNSLSSQWITSEAFSSLVRLIILNLSHNQITHLAPNTFNELYAVQGLDLSNNLISSIADGTFAKMSNLHVLNLNHNRLVIITANMFSGLYVLSKLNLDYNQIEDMESAALRNCSTLKDIGLVRNQLTRVPTALQNLKQLHTLDLGENKIESLSNDSFTGLGQLYGLRIVDNRLTEIHRDFCGPLTWLRVLNVAQNRINAISSTAFIGCPGLRVLRLDSNKLESIPTTLAPQLPNLLWLNVSQNRLKRADYSLLPITLEWFDVSHNQLESLGGAWSKNGLANNNNNTSSPHRISSSNQISSPNLNLTTARLRVVDASHNQLSLLDFHSVPGSLEVLRLSHNRLHKVFPDTFSHSGHLRRVELIGNQLENIPLAALRLPPIPSERSLPEFFLGGNPLLCNCEMEYLTRINQLSALRQHPVVLDLDAIVCRVPFSRTVTHIPLPDIKPQDFLCPYKSHCFHLCHCCDFDACDCEMTCPSNCSCYHDDTWGANVVNCASSGATAIPSRLPMDSTEFYLDGNNIPALKSHTFIGRKNLRILFLNASRIDTIQNKSFNGLQQLTSLHLENNYLKVLHGYEFDHLFHLRELYLQDNSIGSISNATFLSLKALEILRLDGNRLLTFTVWQLSLNPYLVEIGLARNQWNCDCQFLHQLYGWVTDNSRKVIDLGQLQCVWNTTHKPGPHLIDYNRTCGSSWALMEGRIDGFPFSPLPLIFGFVSLILLIIIVLIVVILCRDNARLFLFSHFGIRMCTSSPEEDDEKLYDAYLLYSQKDEEFVATRIADELEGQDAYRLCLHYRDLISESGDLKEMMMGAVENSKSVIVVLSRNFLQGEWASGEYRGGFNAVLKKSQKNATDPKKVVIVFIDDVNPLDVAPDIRSWVRHNRIQVIKWSLTSPDQRKQRKFWSKLKYSLPAPSSHYHSNITSNTTTATSASSNESSAGGIMATLKYNESDQLHNNHHHLQQHHIIVDEYSRTMTMNINNKLWPYGSSNFVALPPPKYQIPNSPGNQSQSGTIQSHLSLNNYNNQSIHSQSSPLHQQYSSSTSHHHPHTNNHHHYHPGSGGVGGNSAAPALPLSNPPKSPPSSQSTSTDSTTTTINGGVIGGDESMMNVHTPTSFSLMFQQMQALQQQQNQLSQLSKNTKSPVPVPKLYNSPNVNNGGGSVLNSSASNNGVVGNSGGESYLSLEGEHHIYSTLDPPSPQAHPTPTTNNRIHLPNGYTYQPQMTMTSQQSSQWHHPTTATTTNTTPKGNMTYGSAKNFKTQQKDTSNNSVQKTYLV